MLICPELPLLWPFVAHCIVDFFFFFSIFLARETDGLEVDKRESVDFSDLLDTSEEREENRKKK